jgi:hypothetical protein
MRKRDELTARERRQFAGLVRTYFEVDAYDPHAAGDGCETPDPSLGVGTGTETKRADGLWARWRRRLRS